MVFNKLCVLLQVGMTLFSHVAGIFRRNFVGLETRGRTPGLEKLQFLSIKVLSKKLRRRIVRGVLLDLQAACRAVGRERQRT